MTDFNPTGFRDAWVNPNRTGLNTGSSGRLVLDNTGRRVFVRPALPAGLFGRTVLSATLRAHVRGSWAAQTVVLTRVTSRWVEGRITSANQPTVTTTGQVSVVTGALADGGVVEWDVTAMMQLFADGTDYFGWRVTTSSATKQFLYATESGAPAWELEITVSDAPDVPTDLVPDNGAVPTGTPHLGWTFEDLGGESTEQATSRVQVDSPAVGVDPDEIAPDYDSGWVTNVEPSWDLAATAYVPPASPPQSTFWRVNVRDGAGDESGWSDWADFTVSAKPSIVVDSPVGAFGDPTPQILAHLSSGTVKAWSIVVTGLDRADVRAESGKQTGPIDWTVPLRKNGRRVLRDDKGGWARIRVWDTVDRSTAVGATAFMQTWVPLTFDEDLAVVAPTSLSVVQLGDGDPRFAWSWQRTEAAEAWLLKVNGHTVVRLDPDDVTLSGGTYSWTDYGILPPLRSNEVSVVAIDNGGKASKPVKQYAEHVVKGVWLVPTDGDDAPVQLAGGDVADWITTDAYASYETVTGGQHDVFYGSRARSGIFEGFVDARNDVWATLDTLEDYRINRFRVFRLVWGSQTIGVRLRDIDGTSSTAILPNTLEHVVRFGFTEYGD